MSREASSKRGAETRAERRRGAEPEAYGAALWLVPALAAALAYWPASRNGFVWDDPLVLQQLRAIRGLADLFVLPSEIPHLYYRPVVFATYLLDRGLGGERPFWFHASVIAWHVANTVMVFFLARILLAGRGASERSGASASVAWFASAAALLFALNPVHVESVAWMAGRSDVIACAFLLAAFLAYLRPQPWGPWLGGLSFLLALLTKEPVALAAAALPLADWTLERGLRPVRWLPFALAVLVYLAMRSAGAGLLGEPALPSGAGAAEVVRALGFYLAKAMLPLRQDVYLDAVPAGGAYAVLGAGGALALALAFVLGWRARSAAVVVSLAWFATTLAPAMLLVVRRIASLPVAERYLYVPSVAVAVLSGWLLLRLAQRLRRERAVLALVAVVALLGAVEIVRRNRLWSDEVLFWTAAAAATADATPQREIADALLRRGQVEEAEAAYLAALDRPASPEERAMTRGNLATLFSRGPRVDEAVVLFQQAIEIRPHPSLYHGLGLAQMRRAERAQAARDQRTVGLAVIAARQAFEQAIALGTAPDAPPAFQQQWQAAKTHLLLGQVLVALNEKDLARQHLERALRLEPSGVTADTARSFLGKL